MLKKGFKVSIALVLSGLIGSYLWFNSTAYKSYLCTGPNDWTAEVEEYCMKR